MGSRFVGLVLLSTLAACSIQERPPRTTPAGGSGGVLREPPDSEIPAGELGAAIRRGRSLLSHTRDSLPGFVGSDLRCYSCHLREGAQANALPLVGVYSRFPQYRARNGLINLLEDRINDCFERSLNGKALPRDGREMREIVAYLAFISRGVAPPGELPGVGLVTLAPLVPDTGRGGRVYQTVCARCHGAVGEGGSVAASGALAPPLWGARSFNIGAGMARLRTAAAFIRENMPFDRAVTLTDQEAFDVAGYIVSRPRPDFAAKSHDWPQGNPPPDVAYPARGGVRKTEAPKTP